MLDNIITLADHFKQADVIQEAQKGDRKTLTADALQEFNDIYDTIISICRIAAKFYADKPHIKDQFVYTKVVKNQGQMQAVQESAMPVNAQAAPLQ